MSNLTPEGRKIEEWLRGRESCWQDGRERFMGRNAVAGMKKPKKGKKK